MAVPGIDIVSQHRLDDSEFRAGLRKQEQLATQFQAKMQRALLLDTTIAQRGLKALSDLIIIFGGSTSFAILQVGRLGLSLTKLSTAYGSVTMSAQAASVAMARASLGASAGGAAAGGAALLGPLGIAVGAAAAAWGIYSLAVSGGTEAINKQTEATNRLLESKKQERDAVTKLAVAQGRMTERTARRDALILQYGPTSADSYGLAREKLNSIEATLAAEAGLARVARNQAEMEHLLAPPQGMPTQEETAQHTFELFRAAEDALAKIDADKVRDADRALQDLWETIASANADRFVQMRAIRGRLANINEERFQRSLADADARSGFSISTVPSSSLRFARPGQGDNFVIGQQQEAKRTNRLLERQNQLQEEEVKLLRRNLEELSAGAG